MLLFLIFFLLLIIFFTSPVRNENARLTLELVFPIGAPITVEKDAIEIPPLVADKTIKLIQKRNIFAEFFTH